MPPPGVRAGAPSIGASSPSARTRSCSRTSVPWSHQASPTRNATVPVPPAEPRRFRVEVERALRIAARQRGIEGQQGQELGAGLARRCDGGTARPVRAGEALRAHVQRPERRVRGGEGQVEGVDGGRCAGAAPGGALQRGLDARAQVGQEVGTRRGRRRRQRARRGRRGRRGARGVEPGELVEEGHERPGRRYMGSVPPATRRHSRTLSSPSTAARSMSCMPMASSVGSSSLRNSFTSRISIGFAGGLAGSLTSHRTTTVTP